MNTIYNEFIHLLFIGIIALFPVINPNGPAFMSACTLSAWTRFKRKKRSRKLLFTLLLFALLHYLAGTGFWNCLGFPFQLFKWQQEL